MMFLYGRFSGRSAFLAFALSFAALGGGAAPVHGAERHPCAGAGRWFPADAAALRAQIEGFIQSASTAAIPQGRPLAIVVPHAGYEYSGRTAAHAYRALRGHRFERVLLLAFSHSAAIDGASALDVLSYETPLGDVGVDGEAVRSLLRNDLFRTEARAHASEHSDENQLPFLQVALDGDFKLVSVLVGPLDSMSAKAAAERLDQLAAALLPLVDEKTLIVASSDFTHYGAPYGYVPFRANTGANLAALDGEAAYWILRGTAEDLLDFFGRTDATVCGRAPLALMKRLLPAGAQGRALHYARSGGGDPDPEDLSVSYFALGFFEGDSNPALPEWIAPAQARAQLSREEQRTLLALARQSIASRMNAGQALRASSFELTPRLMAAQGAFVTLTIEGRLRGCIGNVIAPGPLYSTVARMAQEAAFGDPRFPELSPAEFERIHIEISALLTPEGEVDATPTRPLADPGQIRVGQDGLTIERGFARGLLLPQVPLEYGWNREEYLLHLCQKAGLPPTAWTEARIERFGAQVFGEEERER
ncbi:MAG: hypothetical protein BWZ10_00764 [candidate division BRC1 bacterium ADurb.BinA364]|nr:MAG: hypothetical protein BWZ10_00764 [candidate division BRC1 bacterium ADurb.BinA364]